MVKYILKRIQNKELKKSRNVLKRMKVETFYQALTKGCWSYGVQYQIIIKNEETLEMRLSGKNQALIIKFHRTMIVGKEDYDRFIELLEAYNLKRGVYITTGVFHKDVKRCRKTRIINRRKILIEDGFRFAKGQIGWHGKAIDMLRSRKLKLYNYLPV